MTVKKITYNKKAPFQTKPGIPVENQVTSDDLNEIKDAVNNNADELETKQSKEQGKGLSTNDFTNELKSKLENLNNYDDGEITAKVTELKENVEKIQKEQTTQNKEIEDLQTDNKKNKSDISNIKQEQQEQNSKIESNTTESKDNTELLNQIVGLLPSTKGEGEHVTLDDTAEARFKNFQVQGNSKQETRSGKNAIKSLNRQAKTHISWVLDKSKLEKKMYFSLIASKDLSSTNSIFFNVIDGSLTAINKYAMVIKANVKSIRQIDFTEEELNTLRYHSTNL